MKKLNKIKTKWNDYNTAADKAGIDLDVFCNQTCSDSCFDDATTSTEPVQTILTQCLIKKCHCFRVKVPLPEQKDDDTNSLLEFSKIVATVEAEETAAELLGGDAKDVAKAAAGTETGGKVKKVIDDIWGVPATPEPAKPEAPVTPVAEPEKTAETKPVAPAEKPASPVTDAVKGAVTDSVHKVIADSTATADKAKAEYDATKAEVQAAIKARECDLPCFKECLGLKKYAPYPVIETCVTKKCHCEVSIPNKGALELISVDLIPDDLTTQGVGFFGFLWRFFLAIGIGFAIYLGV